MSIISWLKGEEKQDPIITDLEAQLQEAQEMVHWHTKKLAHHQRLVDRYTQLIEKVKKQNE